MAYHYRWLMGGLSILGAALSLAFTQGVQSNDINSRRYVEIEVNGGATIVPFLGDEDRREVFSLGLQYAKPERAFKWRGKTSELVQEGYYQHSTSRGASGEPANKSEAWGYLAMARYNWINHNGFGWYADIGIGLQYVNRRSVDLPSRLNSTPVLDLGLIIPAGRNSVTVGARFLHISNAHTVGNNQGQNELLFDVGLRF